MPITINNTRILVVTSFLTFGLIACSNSPAPWTQNDDSPWSEKHKVEAEALPSDDAVSDTTLNDSVLLADTEPGAEPELEVEPIVMYEPETAPAPEVIVPVVVEDEPEPLINEIMAMLSSNYAVQVLASKSLDNIEAFKTSKDLPRLMTVKTNVAGSIMYVLVDVYPDRASAEASAAKLEEKTGSKPWIRSLAGLQKIAVQ